MHNAPDLAATPQHPSRPGSPSPIPTAVIVSGLSRSELYRRLGAGEVRRAVKAGKRTWC